MREPARPNNWPRLRWNSLRWRLHHSRVPRMVVAVVATTSLATMAHNSRTAAENAEASWGVTSPVWVARADIAAGALLTTQDLARRSLPALGLPDDATTEDPRGTRSRTSLTRGEILRDGRLSDRAASPMAARLPAATGAVHLLIPSPHLSPGDRVDLYALLSGDRVAEHATVISIDDDLPTVAIALAELPAVVRSFSTGDVVAVLVG